MTRKIALVVIVLATCLAGMATTASAQGVQTGTIRGTVNDPQGLPLPGVTITLTSPALQGQRSTVSAGDGTYLFSTLPPGDYELRFELNAFAPARQTSTIPLGGTAEHNVTLQTAGVTEQVEVVGAVPAPITTPAVGLNIRNDEVEALATSRTLQGIATLAPSLTENSPNSGQVVINGAFAFDNVFMLNGVDVNDNLFGSPQNLFIEDAIQETQVLTSGITAEYGRFSGGVVNAITKSGGNTFDGSYRLNITNPAWVALTPLEEEDGVEHDSDPSLAHEATFGGPIIRDRLWFFAAGRIANTTTANTLHQTGIPYELGDNNRRGEVKVTGSVRDSHTLQGGYLNNYREQIDRPSFPDFSIDPFVIQSRKTPNWYAFANYRGVITGNWLVEAQWSHRDFGFEGSGGTDPNIVESPFITLTQELGHYNAPYFDASDPEQRNNRQLAVTTTSFLEGAAGRHEVKGGYDFFRSQNSGGNSQSATGYVFDADYAIDDSGEPLFDADGRLIPVFEPGASLIENWIPQIGAVLNVDNHSLFVQDHWTINSRWSADVGFRYERVHSEATGNIVGVSTNTIVPRLAAAFDAKGDGSLVFNTTYGHYSGRYNEAQIAANSNVGEPNILIGRYAGPAGQGRDFAPGFDPDNYSIIFGRFPTQNVFFDDDLSSPITREFTVSAGTALGARSFAEISYVWRNTDNFIEDFITAGNGFTDVVFEGEPVSTFTNRQYSNTDLADRRYQALVFQGRHNILPNWTVNGNWTVQLKNHGNYEGEAANQPGLISIIGDFPEAFNEERHFPTGRLANFQRHRARIWSIYSADAGRIGSFSVSGLVRVESGTSFSYVAQGEPITAIQEELLAAYPDFPADQDIYFGERGAGTFPAHAVLDASVNYNIPILGEMRPWLKLDFFNLLNNTKVIGYNTTVTPDYDGPLDQFGLPLNFIRDANFGEPTSETDFPGSMTGLGGEITRAFAFRLSFGLRF